MDELILNFGIDWKLLLAQVVNFGVIFFVLWKFAYGPIVRMLRHRREEIEKGVHAARVAGERLKEAETERAGIVSAAREEARDTVRAAERRAGESGEEIIAEATRKSETVLVAARERAEAERTASESAALERATELITIGVTKVLGKMEPEERDRLLVEAAVRELESLRV